MTLAHKHNRKINSDTTQTDRAVAATQCQRRGKRKLTVLHKYKHPDVAEEHMP